MANNSTESILCFFFLFFYISFNLITISAQANTCDQTSGIFRPNSTYDNNRHLIFSTLAFNVSTHNGYFNVSIGFGQDRVYAMGMCAPGAESDACSNCIENTSDGLLQSCLNQTDGYLWSGNEILCFVRYSNKSFSGLLSLEPYRVFYNSNNITKEVQKDFDSVWDDLMSHVIERASSSVRNNSNGVAEYFAKDEAPVPGYLDISVLTQCSPDVSSKDCKLCLERSRDFYKTWYYGKRGSIILRPSCFFRWELYTFTGAFDSIQINTPPPPSAPLSPPPLESHITKKKDRTISAGIIVAIVVAIVIAVVLILVGLFIWKKRKQNQVIELPTESIQFDLKTIEAATSNFSESNKLGEGGFGEVYKGTLINGTEIAVKRLSKTSGQGEVEFKNEVVVVAKLQHINLVRLLGFSLQGKEKLLVYEYVPNKSLDYFLFDPNKRNQLDWTVRRNIISGITRGILYLHQDSRLKIIHRDLKAGNILLDANMNPKIADFGMARIFGVDQTVANTGRVVGTFGYMSPEYVTHGQFSMKSDVYSFGVLILEIICAKKNSSFYQMDGLVNNLVTYVWRLWENKSLPELIDPSMRGDYKTDEVIRYIHIGMLCVQENPANRPSMSTIYQMLTNSSITLPAPLPPGFFFKNGPGSNPLAQRSEPGQPSNKSFTTCSVDEATITYVMPR